MNIELKTTTQTLNSDNLSYINIELKQRLRH